MVLDVSDKILKLWDSWNIRLALLVSLFLQILLIFFAPLRKWKGDKWVSILIWSAYLLADWVAAFAIGLISSNKSHSSSGLEVFWAPFLLLHLGGPDTITAFSLEDNELWLRHLLSLLFQVIVTIYTFSQSFSNTNSFLLVPTILMFFAGTIKYAERTYALYLACLDTIRESLLLKPNVEPLTKETSDFIRGFSPTNKEEDNGALVQFAFAWFQNIKGLIVDNFLLFWTLGFSRVGFLNFKRSQAFKVVEIELNFMYDILYTKAFVVHSMIGGLRRLTCFIFILISFFLFWVIDKHKHGLEKHGFDIIVTYTLLIGAMSLEVISLVMHIFSNWAIATFYMPKTKYFVSNILTKFSIFNPPKWSESLPQYNLISHCLNDHPSSVSKMATHLGFENFLNEIQFTSKIPITNQLKNAFSEYLETESEQRTSNFGELKEKILSRGKRALQKISRKDLVESTIDVEYDTSVLIWHIATDLLYSTTEEEGSSTINDPRDLRKICKFLSDYMMYLLIMKPTFMAPLLGVGHIRYKKTFEDVKVIFSEMEVKPSSEEIACQAIISGQKAEDFVPQEGRVDSILSDGCVLVHKLKGHSDSEMWEIEMWEIISKVWIEILFYAASQCKGRSHVQQLSKGGEFLTIVWLLMVHFGFALNSRFSTTI